MYRVLLIEPALKETELYSDLLREIPDCQVDVVSRAEHSYEWISRLNYHLVVVDASPTSPADTGLDALGLLERIRRLSPATSVIVISELATVEEAVAAIRLGAEDYLKKPVNLDAFRRAVKRGLDRKVVFGANTGISGLLNLLNSCQMISASLEEGKIFSIIQSYFQRELHSNYSAIYVLKGEDAVRVEAPGGENVAKDRAMEEILDIALQLSHPLHKMAASGETHRFIERGQLAPGLFVFRFRCAGEQDYFCVCLSPEPPAAMDPFESRLRMLKTQIELSGKNVEQYRGVESLAYVDDVTGLYNTRYLNNLLDREIAQAEVTKKSFAVLFIDADKFKGVNDTHGHLVGSRLLNELGHILKKYVRERDTVFRYGGDEFVAVLSRCDLPTAKTVAERIRDSVEKHAFLSEEGGPHGALNLHFTVSIGVALFPDHANSKKAVIDAADHAMYTAKKSTRNSVFIAPLGPGKPDVPASAPTPEPAAAAAPVPAPVSLKTDVKKKKKGGRGVG